MLMSLFQVPSCEDQVLKPPPKRRRILDPSAIVPVPVYSNKVGSCFLIGGELAAQEVSSESSWILENDFGV